MTSEDPNVIRLSVTEGDEESRLKAVAELVETASPEDLAGLVVNLSIQNIALKEANESNVEAIRQTLIIATKTPEGDDDLARSLDSVQLNSKAIASLMDYVSHNFIGAPRCTQDDCEECSEDDEMEQALVELLDGLSLKLDASLAESTDKDTTSHA